MKKSEFRRKTFIRITSMLLTLLILFAVPPTVVYAEALGAIASIGDGDGDGAAVEADGDAADAYTTLRDVYEVTELREESVKHFRLEDGSYVAMAYDAPVHYAGSDGSWVDIDNRLSDVGSEYSTSNARIKFSKKITGNGTLFTLHENNTKITLSLIDAIKKTEGRVTSDHSTDEREETTLGKLANLENLTSSILYEDILEGVDLEYVVRSLNVKENIIVKERLDSYTFTFELALNNLTAALTDTGDVRIADASGKTAYVIPAPIVFDNGGAYAPRDAAGYTLTGGESGKYTLTVSVSPDWMNADERVYPITVDPTVKPGEDNVTDLYITPGVNSNFVNGTTSRVVGEGVYYWRTSSLPTLPSSYYLVGATMLIKSYTSSNAKIGAYQVISDWDEEHSWTKYSSSPYDGDLSNVTLDYVDEAKALAEESADGWLAWDVSVAVKDWYENPTYNYGLGFKALTTGANSVYHANGGANSPKLVITYRDMKGMEGYYSTISHNSCTVNLANGNLVHSVPLLSTTDHIMPMTVGLVYNSALNLNPYVYGTAQTPYLSQLVGRGFKLNIQETLYKKSFVDISGATDYCYILADADGTEHYFYSSANDASVYVDEDGLRLTMDTSDTSNITVTDVDGNSKHYSQMTSSAAPLGGWYLSAIEDKPGNQVVITVDSGYKPTSISLKPAGLDPIEMLKLVYNSSGMLSIVYNPTSKQAAILRYSSSTTGNITTSSTKYLRRIDYAVGGSSVTEENWINFYNNELTKTNITFENNSIEYTYSNFRLSQIVDVKGGMETHYTYDTASRISSVQEKTGTYTGQKVTISYSTDHTDVRASGNDDIHGNSDDIITRYVFDSLGRTVNAYRTSTDFKTFYGSVSTSYESQANIVNNVKQSTAANPSITNRLLNGSFEKAGSWTMTDMSRYNADKYYIDSYHAYTYLTYPDVASLSQSVYLPAGDYTMFFDYQITMAGAGVDLVMSVTSDTTSSVSFTKSVGVDELSSPVSLDNVWNRAQMNFTVEEDDYYTVKITASATDADTRTGLSIDNVSICDGIGMRDYDYVQQGNFENTGSWFTSNGGTVYISSNSGSPLGNSGKIQGSISSNGTGYITQNIYTAPDSLLYSYDHEGETDVDEMPIYYTSNTDKTYVVSAMANAPYAIVNDNTLFCLRVEVSYYQGEGEADRIRTYDFPFLPHLDSWQLVTGSFKGEYIPDNSDLENLDNYDYSLIRSIDIKCCYDNQPSSTAYFDNVTCVINDSMVVTNEYDAAGNLTVVSNGDYNTYYEYNTDNSIRRIANDNGEITDYSYGTYSLCNSVTSYTFTRNDSSSTVYPYGASYPDSLITKHSGVKTSYVYDTYGLVSAVTVMMEKGTNDPITATKSVFMQYRYDSTAGSHIFGALIRETDSAGKAINYVYDQSNGNLLATLDETSGEGVCYSYDVMGRMIGARPAIASTNGYTAITSDEHVSYIYDEDGYLTGITTGSTEYTLFHDVYGNNTGVMIDGVDVISYEYNQNNGKLNEVMYTNGFSEEYVYDTLENLVEIWYNYSDGTREKAVEYSYMTDGRLCEVHDVINGRVTVYDYDAQDRLNHTYQYDTDDGYIDLNSVVRYDTQNRLTKVIDKISYPVAQSTASSVISQSYGYTRGQLTTVSTELSSDSSFDISYTYDYLHRLSGTTSTAPAGWSITSTYTYLDRQGTTNRTTEYIGSVNTVTPSSNTTYDYTYDSKGNITKIVITEGTSVKEIRYVYDDVGQLIREDNEPLDVTYVYNYDDAGNLSDVYYYDLTAADTVPIDYDFTDTYSYSDETLPDALYFFNGDWLEYDTIGNPTVYFNYTGNYSFFYFTWTGRELTSATRGNDSYTFEYNENGLRVSKIKNGVESKYYYDGDLLLMEVRGDVTLYFLYDEGGSPIGMRYRQNNSAEGVWQNFWYEKNIFGDIVAIYNDSGTKLVSYVYDAWGRTEVTYHNGGASTGAALNPFTYRSYYYDSDLGFYYLQSRYYDPAIRRFINADSIDFLGANGDLLSYNLYAYCSNNPVMYTDPSGHELISVFIAILIVGVLSATTTGIVSYYNDVKGWELVKNITIGFAFGVAAAGLFFAGTGALTIGLKSATGLIKLSAIKVFGAEAIKVFALGALSVNVSAYLILPAFNIEIEGIEYEKPKPVIPNKTYNENRAQQNLFARCYSPSPRTCN